MTHEEMARANFRDGYNCAQAVLVAFRDVTGLDEKQSAMLASSFGGGMGRLREVCGAVSGIFMVLGILEGYSSPKAVEEKAAHYRKVQRLAAEFTAAHQTIICRELLGLNVKKEAPEPSARTPEYYSKRPCEEFIGNAAKILDEYLAGKLT